MKSKLYRKKPIVIEAIQYLREQNIGSVQDFVGKYLHYDPEKNEYAIETLEGTSYFLTKDDWVIKGINGEFYPCKPDIFEKTYEPAAQQFQQPVKDVGVLVEALREINDGAAFPKLIAYEALRQYESTEPVNTDNWIDTEKEKYPFELDAKEQPITTNEVEEWIKQQAEILYNNTNMGRIKEVAFTDGARAMNERDRKEIESLKEQAEGNKIIAEARGEAIVELTDQLEAKEKELAEAKLDIEQWRMEYILLEGAIKQIK